jgi:haloalkane dehalogenase
MQTPPWLDTSEYPFAHHYFQLPAGRMHYIDEGSGSPIVFVHGTPTWSFLYRKLIRRLSAEYRCLAIDHLGFGLSEKPAGFAYTPQAHADNLEAFVDGLGLKDITLVVHDFGGPIGLAYALRHPQNVARVAIFNTWMWSLKGNRKYTLPGAFFASPLGRLLYERFNFSARVMMRLGAASKEELPPEVHRQYLAALPDPRSRHGTWVLARELIGSSHWYDTLWKRRGHLANKPALLLWGVRDSAFDRTALARWYEVLPHARVVTFPDTGHFVQEAKGEESAAAISAFILGGEALKEEESRPAA